MSTIDVQHLSATLSIRGERFSPISASLSIVCDQYSTLELTFHANLAGRLQDINLIQLDGGDVTETFQTLNRWHMNPNARIPDVHFRVTSNGRVLVDWKGFLTQPYFTITKDMTIGVQCVGVESRLGLFQPSIYQTTATSQARTTTRDTAKNEDGVGGHSKVIQELMKATPGSLHLHFREAMRLLRSTWLEQAQAQANMLTPLNYALLMAKHSMNELVAPEVAAFLSRGDTNWPAALQVFDQEKSWMHAFFANHVLTELLLRPDGGFWGPADSAAYRLMEAFGLTIRPVSLGFNAYEFALSINKFRTTGTLEIPFAHAVGSFGSVALMPITHVVVYSDVQTKARTTTKDTGKNTPEVRRRNTNIWPKQATDIQRILPVRMPPWADDTGEVLAPRYMERFAKERKDQVSTNYNLLNFAKELGNVDIFAEQYSSKILSRVGDNWAELNWKEQRYRNSTFRVHTAAFNPRTLVGRRYMVTSAGRRICEGWLAGATHTIGLRDASVVTANSSFSFSHVFP